MVGRPVAGDGGGNLRLDPEGLRPEVRKAEAACPAVRQHGLGHRLDRRHCTGWPRRIPTRRARTWVTALPKLASTPEQRPIPDRAVPPGDRGPAGARHQRSPPRPRKPPANPAVPSPRIASAAAFVPPSGETPPRRDQTAGMVSAESRGRAVCEPSTPPYLGADDTPEALRCASVAAVKLGCFPSPRMARSDREKPRSPAIPAVN
jgi:hypothetical protein